MDIIIDEQFRTIIPPLTEDELSRLEDSILVEGVRDKLIVWNNTLVDGHNRYRIATTLGLPFETISMNFESREHALNWVISNQLGRRNLNPNQIAYLRGKRYEVEKNIKSFKGNQYSGAGQNDQHQNEEKYTSQRLGEEYGVGERTIRRNAEYAKAIDKMSTNVKEKMLSGECTIGREQVSSYMKLEPTIQKKVIKEIENGVSVSDAIKKFDSDTKRRENDDRIKREIEADRESSRKLKFSTYTLRNKDITVCTKQEILDNIDSIPNDYEIWLFRDLDKAHKAKIELRRILNLKINQQ